jgi:hypothetical protein
MDSYWPETSLADLLDIHLQNYHDDFRKYWHLDAEACPPGLSADDWLLARLLDQVGARMLSSVHALRVDRELAAVLRNHRPLETPEDVAADLVRYDIARARAEIELASLAVSRLFEGKKRVAILLLLLSKFELSERAGAYADRMVQCFIWGLDTECAVMARSVLESALEETFPDEKMVALGFTRGRYGFEYWQYRDAATVTQLLSEERLKDVERIRTAGNEAVHAAPGLHPPAYQTVARTVACLRDLFPERSF